MTKAELLEQVKSLTDEEAAQTRLIYAPGWPSRSTSIDEVRGRLGTRPMSPDQRDAFWRDNERHLAAGDGKG